MAVGRVARLEHHLLARVHLRRPARRPGASGCGRCAAPRRAACGGRSRSSWSWRFLPHPLSPLTRTPSTIRRLASRKTSRSGQRRQRRPGHDRAVGLRRVGAAEQRERHRQREHVRLVHGDQRPRKSFQADRKAKIPSAASTGWDRGSTMRVNTRHVPAPSIRAASSTPRDRQKNRRSRTRRREGHRGLRNDHALVGRKQARRWVSTYWAPGARHSGP